MLSEVYSIIGFLLTVSNQVFIHIIVISEYFGILLYKYGIFVGLHLKLNPLKAVRTGGSFCLLCTAVCMKFASTSHQGAKYYLSMHYG